jgi:hypothetical protein
VFVELLLIFIYFDNLIFTNDIFLNISSDSLVSFRKKKLIFILNFNIYENNMIRESKWPRYYYYHTPLVIEYSRIVIGYQGGLTTDPLKAPHDFFHGVLLP